MPEIKEAFKFESAGAQTVGANKDRWEAPFPGQAISVAAVAGTAPTGAALIVDVLLNGTTIFAGTKPTIAAGATSSGAVAVDPAVGRFVAGDVLSLSVTQIGSGVAGSDLDVTVGYVAT